MTVELETLELADATREQAQAIERQTKSLDAHVAALKSVSKGEQGETGEIGPVGPIGPAGKSIRGLPGADGKNGKDGAAGPVGPGGKDGKPGSPGKDGVGPDERVKVSKKDPAAGFLSDKLKAGLGVRLRQEKSPDGDKLVIDSMGQGAASGSGGLAGVKVYDDGAGNFFGDALSFDGGDPVTVSGGIIHVPVGGGGGGAVASVNGQTGVVVLDAEDVGAVAGFVQPTDPGAVGAGAIWVDTSNQPATVSTRNETDDGWDPIGELPDVFPPSHTGQPISTTGQSAAAPAGTGTFNATYYLRAPTYGVWQRTTNIDPWEEPSADPILSGTADPSGGGGVAHADGQFYVREDADGVPFELWLGGSGGNTDWTEITSDTMWQGQLDLFPVSPADATGFGTAAPGSVIFWEEGIFRNLTAANAPVWAKVPSFLGQGFLAIYFPPDGMLADGIPVELDLEVDAGLGIRSAAIEQALTNGQGFEQTIWKNGRLLERLVAAAPTVSVREYAPISTDPSTGAGLPHDIPGFVARANGAALEIWATTGSGDTDWAIPGGSTATDPGDIADPTLATPESNALKINALFANMRTAGMLA